MATDVIRDIHDLCEDTINALLGSKIEDSEKIELIGKLRGQAISTGLINILAIKIPEYVGRVKSAMFEMARPFYLSIEDFMVSANHISILSSYLKQALE